MQELWSRTGSRLAGSARIGLAMMDEDDDDDDDVDDDYEDEDY
jgi:hypothetical protein